MPNVSSSPNYLNGSITQLISPNPSPLQGIFVSSATGATIAIFDTGTSTVFTPALVSSFTPIGGTWYPLPFNAKNGLNMSIAGTVTYTVGFG